MVSCVNWQIIWLTNRMSMLIIRYILDIGGKRYDANKEKSKFILFLF